MSKSRKILGIVLLILFLIVGTFALSIKIATVMLGRFLGNERIDYYGKVIDEDGKALSGAKVTFVIKAVNTNPLALLGSFVAAEMNYTKKERIVFSDDKGDFKLKGETGAYLDIDVEKEGYVHATEGKKFLTYSRRHEDHYTPSKEKPEIYKLWKEEKTELLIKYDRSKLFDMTDNSVLINLICFNKASSINDSDIKITITCPENISGKNKNYGWSSSIEAIDGGIVEADNENIYLAPEQSYVPIIKHDIKLQNEGKWERELVKRYYFKSRGGRIYGFVEIEYISFYNNGPVAFVNKVILNPNGSRVLVYNYKKLINNPSEFYKSQFKK